MDSKRLEPKCVVCGKERPGLDVKADGVIKAMRWISTNVFRRQYHDKLVVCKDCYIGYSKARKKYVRKQATYVIIGAIFAALLLIASHFKPLALVYGLGIVVFLYLLSLVSYVPALDMGKAEQDKTHQKKPR